MVIFKVVEVVVCDDCSLIVVIVVVEIRKSSAEVVCFRKIVGGKRNSRNKWKLEFQFEGCLLCLDVVFIRVYWNRPPAKNL